MEASLAADEVSVIAERDAALGDDGIEFGEGVEVAVDDRLVDMDPERLGWLKLGGVGWQVNEADALGHGERRGVPAGAIEHEDDDPVWPGTGLAGEEGQGVLEQRLVDTGREIPEALAGRRRDEGGDVEPFEAVVAAGDRPLAARRPDPPQDRLQPDVTRNRVRSTRCSSVAKTSITAPGWRSASSVTASARFC